MCDPQYERRSPQRSSWLDGIEGWGRVPRASNLQVSFCFPTDAELSLGRAFALISPKCRPSVAVQKSAYSCAESEMRNSEPKPHSINELLVSFDSEVRKRKCRTMMRTSESGHECGGSEVRAILAASSKCGLLNRSHTRSMSCWCPSIPKFANESAAQ